MSSADPLDTATGRKLIEAAKKRRRPIWDAYVPQAHKPEAWPGSRQR
jgi:hypothetical protein